MKYLSNKDKREAVNKMWKANPFVSVREIARETGIAKSTVQRALREIKETQEYSMTQFVQIRNNDDKIIDKIQEELLKRLDNPEAISVRELEKVYSAVSARQQKFAGKPKAQEPIDLPDDIEELERIASGEDAQ